MVFRICMQTPIAWVRPKRYAYSPSKGGRAVNTTLMKPCAYSHGATGNKLRSVYLVLRQYIEFLTSRRQGRAWTICPAPGGVHFVSGPVQVWIAYGPGGGEQQDVPLFRIIFVSVLDRPLLSGGR